MINEHLLSLGIDPKIPPVELLSNDFLEQVRQHARGDARARASEMEHAIRRHLTVHLERDPEFYKRMSQKLERLIKQYGENWDLLAEKYEDLRREVVAGRTGEMQGLGHEATTFYSLVRELAFGDVAPSGADAAKLKRLMQQLSSCCSAPSTCWISGRNQPRFDACVAPSATSCCCPAFRR